MGGPDQDFYKWTEEYRVEREAQLAAWHEKRKREKHLKLITSCIEVGIGFVLGLIWLRYSS